MKCEKCSSEMKDHKEGHSIGRICETCGNGVTTSVFEPFETDQTEYKIFLLAKLKYTGSDLKVISKIANYNYLQAKEMTEHTPVEIFSGQAREAKKVKETLENAKIPFSIEPEFRY